MRKRELLVVMAACVGCVGSIGDGSTGDTAGAAPATGPAGAASRDQASGAMATLPGATPSAPPGTTPAAGGPCVPGPRRLWRLTPAQYLSTLAALLPDGWRAADDISRTLATADTAFANDPSLLTLSTPHTSQLFDNAKAVVQAVFADAGKLQPCLAAATPDRACVQGFVQGFLTRAFRRPVTQAELDGYLATYDHDAPVQGAKPALQELLQAALLSPSFLFRTELGPEAATGGTTRLTAYETASALSYLFTDGPPDADLLAAAARNELGTPQQLEAQARRLLAGKPVVKKLQSFFDESLGMDRLAGVKKDAKAFPKFTADLAADMGREVDAFVAQALFQEDGRLETVLSAPFGMANARLASYYGANGITSMTTFQKVQPPTGTRAGLLSLPGVMTLYAHEDATDIVRRGRLVREKLLCESPPPPPPNVNAFPPVLDGVRTQREILANHSANPACATCHQLMDPLGLTFENYDGVGVYRTTEAGKPIDASARVAAANLPARDVRNAVELAGVLGTAEQVRQCFTGRMHRYLQGQEANACTGDVLLRRFATSSGDVKDLMIGIVTAQDFVTRSFAR